MEIKALDFKTLFLIPQKLDVCIRLLTGFINNKYVCKIGEFIFMIDVL